MATSTVLKFSRLDHISNHFAIPPDESEWTDKVGAYTDCFDSKGKKIGCTPARHRADFETLSKSMLPTTERGQQMDSSFGVYLLAFDIPTLALYVGVAAASSKSPEGVLSRVRKHRIKLTASHIGRTATTHGGVNHTGGWRAFAERRARHFVAQKVLDVAEDARITIGEFVPSAGADSHKVEAEWFEHQITASGRAMDDIVNLLWPGMKSADVTLLTIGTSRGVRPAAPEIELWDGLVQKF